MSLMPFSHISPHHYVRFLFLVLHYLLRPPPACPRRPSPLYQLIPISTISINSALSAQSAPLGRCGCLAWQVPSTLWLARWGLPFGLAALANTLVWRGRCGGSCLYRLAWFGFRPFCFWMQRYGALRAFPHHLAAVASVHLAALGHHKCLVRQVCASVNWSALNESAPV